MRDKLKSSPDNPGYWWTCDSNCEDWRIIEVVNGEADTESVGEFLLTSDRKWLGPLSPQMTLRQHYSLLSVNSFLEAIADLSSDKASRKIAKRALAYVKELLP